MTLLLIEGFDHSQNLGLKNWVSQSGGGPSWEDRSGLAGPRVGSLGHSYEIHSHCNLGIGAGQGNAIQLKVFPSTTTQAILGFGWYTDSFTAGDRCRVALCSAGGGVICYVRINGTRNIEVCNSGGGVIATSSNLMQIGIWHYIELRVKVAGASGEIQLMVDGGADVPTTVANLGTTPVGAVQLYAHSTGDYNEETRHYVDDMYVLDANTGSAPHNDFLNDCRVETLIPVAPGAASDWTPLAGANWAAVDEMAGTFPDGDTTYVTAQNTGQKDLYVCSDMSTVTALVYGVQANLTARKDTAGFKQIKPMFRQGGVNYGGGPMTLSTSYVTKQQIFERDPTGALWTPATINNDEYGMEVIV